MKLIEDFKVLRKPIARLPQWLSSKESACNTGGAEDTRSIPRLGRGGHGNPFQYPCLENPWTEVQSMGLQRVRHI